MTTFHTASFGKFKFLFIYAWLVGCIV
jgi:hypothetical protein